MQLLRIKNLIPGDFVYGSIQNDWARNKIHKNFLVLKVNQLSVTSTKYFATRCDYECKCLIKDKVVYLTCHKDTLYYVIRV